MFYIELLAPIVFAFIIYIIPTPEGLSLNAWLF